MSRSNFLQNVLAVENQAKAAGSCMGLDCPLDVRWRDRHWIRTEREISKMKPGAGANEGMEEGDVLS
jgi:hypothetical protein